MSDSVLVRRGLELNGVGFDHGHVPQLRVTVRVDEPASRCFARAYVRYRHEWRCVMSFRTDGLRTKPVSFGSFTGEDDWHKAMNEDLDTLLDRARVFIDRRGRS